jgi:hypothetical protein
MFLFAYVAGTNLFIFHQMLKHQEFVCYDYSVLFNRMEFGAALAIFIVAAFLFIKSMKDTLGGAR